MTANTRVEHDSLGSLDVPAEALWGASTQRAIQNFPPSGLRMPRAFIEALALIKHAAAEANAELGDLPAGVAAAIQDAALKVASGAYDEQFPVDVFQTGSGTSSNMNANEVIASLASQALGAAVHPNDQVNMSQSSNDVVPTAIHVSAALLLQRELLPALARLQEVLSERGAELAGVVKTGRTHLMDAMPITLAQELGGWQAQMSGVRNPVGGGDSAAACPGAGRHCGGHWNQRTGAIRRGVRAAFGQAHRHCVSARGELFRGAGESGYRRGTLGPDEGLERQLA